MSRGQIADVERGPGKAGELEDLPFAQEALGDAALIEYLDGAGVQAAGAGLDDRLIGAPLDHGNVDIGERELGGQHQPSRAAAGDHDGMVSRRFHRSIGALGAAA